MSTNYNSNYNFLNNSILFDKYTSPKNDEYLPKIINRIRYLLHSELCLPTSGRDISLYSEHLEQFVYNLIVSVITSRPIAISKDRNNYGSSGRYHKIQFQYAYTKRILEKLLDYHYIYLKPGVFYTNSKRVTRFWPTEKFISLLGNDSCPMPIKEFSTETIRLHAKKHHKHDKKLKAYDDSVHPEISSMRSDIELINQTLNDASVDLKISNEIISGNYLRLIDHNNLFTNITKLHFSDTPIKIIRSLTTNTLDNLGKNQHLVGYHYKNYNICKSKNFDIEQFVYNLIPVGERNSSLLKQIDLNKLMNKLFEVSIGKSCCEYYWVKDLHLTFCHKTYHRVFNEDFDLGGRLYNAYLQQIPKYLRKNLTINNNKTIELDYSAQHLRMLYHKKGIDYRDDPYAKLINQSDEKINYMEDIINISPSLREVEEIVSKTGIYPNIEIFTKHRKFKEIKERSKFKVAQLILINAMDKVNKKGREMPGEEVAIKGIISELNEIGVAGVNKNMVQEIIKRFKEVHEPIEEYLYSGIALKLQNLDSKIMNEILVTLAREGIAALPYHDSVRIEEQHEKLLRELMMEVYHKHAGFYPVI